MDELDDRPYDDDDAYEDGYQDGREGFTASPFFEYEDVLIRAYEAGHEAGCEDRRRKAKLDTRVA